MYTKSAASFCYRIEPWWHIPVLSYLPMVSNRIGKDLTGFLLFVPIWLHLNNLLFLTLWAQFLWKFVEITWNRIQWFISTFWCCYILITTIFCVCVLLIVQFTLFIWCYLHMARVQIDQKQEISFTVALWLIWVPVLKKKLPEMGV